RRRVDGAVDRLGTGELLTPAKVVREVDRRRHVARVDAQRLLERLARLLAIKSGTSLVVCRDREVFLLLGKAIPQLVRTCERAIDLRARHSEIVQRDTELA